MSGRLGLVSLLMLTASGIASAQQVYSPNEPGLALPVVTSQARAAYTPEAFNRRIEGTVTLDCDVMTDGSVSAVLVTESLDRTYGLDEQAIAAVRTWKFRPGTKDGTPVPVRVGVAIRFTLERSSR